MFSAGDEVLVEKWPVAAVLCAVLARLDFVSSSMKRLNATGEHSFHGAKQNGLR